ncbi:RNA-guided endonuclease TnpB family protein [Truepera radiovictrix]|jgi:putative transposase|uniref:Transposase, IS605 OrfB family n=1 Tax=Truepera radiovictrix (strain DSM 17093 / CIP 108686 / LMG 22925 / RQ-24) TaxID=649638 RepID=D7CSR8_TRURR|nr:RNA-guided endonuclease TnpB family protein [Truepera radiovictrix]ADI13685.1 transposase, IS605 OrfB family [Truepera radiovictrix DSM 17093]ADI13748.1 transposase, IS605 OrfB family [Truepera radiovictrix DSM 17093]ADI13770.1 transposase, IS605 OrfB family [Truepera radiovictrix DSM 17093]WMT57663.1 transposase [Truepera radiovictrix]WMT57687.1 transposase [Truepera radiovictrix]
MLLRKVYRFQMRPTKAQEELLCQMAGAKRFVFNWALARRRDFYEANKEGISAKQLSSELTDLKKQPETGWLKGVDSQLLQQALKDVDRSFKNFFEKRSRFPRFKSRKREMPSFRIPQRVKVEDGKVYVPKIGWVRIRQSQDIDCKTKSATFKRDATGKWYVTLTAEFEMPDVPLPPAKPENVVGIDLGLKDFAVLSSGEREAPPKHYRAAEKKLKRAQRALSRKQKGSKNRDRARQQLARIHQKVRNKRQDFLHKMTTSLVRGYEGICIEDLSLKGMARTKLAKSVSDAALGEFRRQLEYKTVWHRKHLAVIDRFFPSSKLHMECGAINDALTLADRVWTCACGAVIDRDLNAAHNIKVEGLKQLVAAGHAETLNACGAQVRPTLISRHSAVKQESHVL